MALLIDEINGSFDFSGVMVRDIPFSPDSISEIIPIVTKSFPVAGWMILERAVNICSLENILKYFFAILKFPSYFRIKDKTPVSFWSRERYFY